MPTPILQLTRGTFSLAWMHMHTELVEVSANPTLANLSQPSGSNPVQPIQPNSTRLRILDPIRCNNAFNWWIQDPKSKDAYRMGGLSWSPAAPKHTQPNPTKSNQPKGNPQPNSNRIRPYHHPTPIQPNPINRCNFLLAGSWPCIA